MKSLDLVQGEFFNPEVECLKPRELFYLRLKSWNNLSPEVEELIRKATSYSSEVYISIPGLEYEDLERRNFFFDLGVKGFSLRLTHNVSKWLAHEGIGNYHSGDRDLIHSFAASFKNLPETKDLIVEFQIADDLRVLAPTIAGLYREGIKWVVLNVEDAPSSQRCTQFREIFEYLKIRSCNRLNVYFPFWNEYFREWDIKTQNTFAGLQFVHIDISNRCTHSCVFCALYSPESVEDQKVRGGGKLPAAITDHMKKEIDSEKCLGIINSLPWSVHSIQFGGFGDPLMHQDAVHFIAAARERGFLVEMLSNMEYLDDTDIHRLHLLGGKTFAEMHFIANISAGDPEIYVKTRPKQTDKNYFKIVHNLSLFSELREKNNGTGVHFTVMCVVNTLNAQYLLEVAKLAKQIRATRIWFKPMEAHSVQIASYIPAKSQMKSMAKSLKEAVAYAESNGIEIFQKDYCEAIINQHSGDTINV